MNAAAQCLKCGRTDARPFEVRLFRKLGVEYAPSIPGDAAIRTFTGYEPAAARTFHICARCQSNLLRAILVVPVLRIVGFVIITAGVIWFWDRVVGDWRWGLGLLEGWAVIYLGLPGLIVLGRIALMALLDLGEMRSELLIDAAYSELDREFGDALASRADRYSFDEIGVPEQVGKLHALTALEIAVLAPREAHMARLRTPSRPADDETPLRALRISAICAAFLGVCRNGCFR